VTSAGIPRLVLHLARHIATALDRRLAPFNLTGQQASLLRACVMQDFNPTRLAPLIGTDAAGMTRLLDRLESKGLIVRRGCPADRRAIVIEPTDAGRSLIPQIIAVFREVLSRPLDGFSAEEAEVFEKLLLRALENVTADERGTGGEKTLEDGA
jgi:DNA-binding MarR family transcriptional regulator